MAEHYSVDGSYVFVVDKKGALIYHPDKNRIGENVKENLVVQKLMRQIKTHFVDKWGLNAELT